MESKKGNKPFYALPEKIPTSSQIVNEARSSLRTYETRRPNTPRDEQRHLFPSSTSRNPESRPPSAFSLSSRHFDGPDSRPVSGTRLSPLDHTPRAVNPSDIENNILVPRPPSSEPKTGSRRGSGNRIRGPLTSNSDAGEVRPRSPVLDALHEKLSSENQNTHIPYSHSDERITRAPDGVVAPSSAGSDGRTGSAGSRKSSAGKSSRTSSAGKRDVEDPDEIFVSQIQVLLTELATLTKKKDCDKVYDLAGKLYFALETNNCLCKQYTHRAGILKLVFKLLDVEEPRILLRLARIILAFKVSGNNLLNVCKLVFKVSRNERNDKYFLEENILNLLLETIRSTDPLSGCEALIYCVGAVKFLTGNADILKRLARLDCVKTLALLLDSINELNKEANKAKDQHGHILVQLAAALRNLADTSSGRDRFISHKVINGLVQLLDTYPTDCDLMLYISRIFSKITLHSDCCNVLADQQTYYKAVVHLLDEHILKEDLVVRLCFVLGNLTIKNDAARLKLFKQKNSIKVLEAILKTYLDLDSQGKITVSEVSGQSNDQAGSGDGLVNNKVEDILVKVMRVLANLSINEEVGPEIAANSQFVRLLLSVIDKHEVCDHEELVINAVVAVNNLSYYTVQDFSLMELHLSMANTLLKLIFQQNMEGILEASRVLANLTRHKEIRDFLSDNKVDEVMVALLDSGNREIVYIACGVLINFMTDEEKRPILKKEGGIQKLIDVLRDFGHEDWQLSGCVCKVLVNYSSRIHSSENSFGQTECQELSDILVQYLDKEAALTHSLELVEDEEMRAFIEDSWMDEFCSVGGQLLKRIEAHSSPLEPLDDPS